MFLEIAAKVKSEMICCFQLCFSLSVKYTVDGHHTTTTELKSELNQILSRC